jgi:transcription elongation factor Elf1
VADTIEYVKCPSCGYEDSLFLVNKTESIECPKCGKWGIFSHHFGANQGLSIAEYTDLVVDIYENHGWRHLGKSKNIKYVRGMFDTRTGRYFGVILDSHEFIINNENRHRNLKRWITEFLNE